MAATSVGPVNGIGPGLPGGCSAWLNITSAQVIKASAGILVRVFVNTVGSAGSLTFNDVATVGGAAASNQILTIAYTSLTVGQQMLLQWPCATGIVVSAVPTSGVIAVSYS